MTGLRISIGRALIGTVAAEFFTGIGGLGGLIQKYGASYQTDYMLVPVLTLMLIGRHPDGGGQVAGNRRRPVARRN